MDIPQTGDPYLTSILHDSFVRDIIRPPSRPQQFVGLPITSQPENLDLRGPQGISAEEVKALKNFKIYDIHFKGCTSHGQAYSVVDSND